MYSLGKSRNQIQITLDHPQVDRSFIEGEPCEPPCWHGLDNNISTMEDALSTLHELDFVLEDSIRERGTAWEGDDTARSLSFDCVYTGESEFCGHLTFTDGILRSSIIGLYFTMTSKEVVELLGEPDTVASFIAPPDYCDVSQTWWKKGITVTYDSDSYDDKECKALKDGEGFNPDLQINSVVNFSRGDPSTCDADSTVCMEWMGFR